ncbi:hypothetical protein RHECIAT_CH0002091 [Rhizobium etli CIAT 652]|uniref:Uncharacterized protein n=1 Tax=Rhizobium etli (strain CIAT 652) TaxID=491916 RepID=B3PZI5_RHIE6|nr:hypothetical protein RHECIAT_CH0002091 [Rhizobium etli CIAT 652]
MGRHDRLRTRINLCVTCFGGDADEPTYPIGRSRSADRPFRHRIFLHLACEARQGGFSISAGHVEEPGLRRWIQTQQRSLMQLLKPSVWQRLRATPDG